MVVPRLGVSFDPKGDGQWVLQASYAVYAGKAAETQFADNTNVGTPNRVDLATTAPPARASTSRPASTSPTTPCSTAASPSPTCSSTRAWRRRPRASSRCRRAPGSGQRGEIKAIYTNRRTGTLLDDFITPDTGQTTVIEDGRTFGTFDNAFITNTDISFRKYDALQLDVELPRVGQLLGVGPLHDAAQERGQLRG